MITVLVYILSPAAGTDFVSISHNLTFLSGESTKEVVIIIEQDDVLEETEMFYAVLSSSSPRAEVSETQGRAEIILEDSEQSGIAVTTFLDSSCQRHLFHRSDCQPEST